MITVYFLVIVLLYNLKIVFTSSFRQLPTRFVPVATGVVEKITVTSLEECAQIGSNQKIIAIYYDLNSTCIGYSGIRSYVLGTEEAQTTGQAHFVWYLRDNGGGCGCTTAVRAQQLISDYTYGDTTCSSVSNLKYDANSGYCTARTSNVYDTELGYYVVGAVNNGTIYTMTRAQISESVNYDCSEVTPAIPVVYNDIWYCLAIIKTNKSGYQTVRDNICSQYQTNGTPVKIVHLLVYGMVSLFTGNSAVIGLWFNGTSYVYYDNTTAPSLIWDTGRPTGLRMVTVNRKNFALKDFASNNGTMNCLTKVEKSP
ncbi:unnamed protein product [Bursaphelenchus xylophilus]|uniref:(pine wood nematode) hypothetical protein n=1 Tax=Bursaphelenchus xylophilus TaxID=6326 RepID=A0A1I7SLP6_BURXY|nr:unnamed protein product [Bursaphelenchus xylophilus]CAG9129694.1 unnamed protein product [Bursaphelenchus xylophilus]